MTTKVSLEGNDGTVINGELAEPAGSDKAPALVLIQEYWGINDHIRAIADRLAKEGFLVIAPTSITASSRRTPPRPARS